jgi:hypothetical protein
MRFQREQSNNYHMIHIYSHKMYKILFIHFIIENNLFPQYRLKFNVNILVNKTNGQDNLVANSPIRTYFYSINKLNL